MMALSPFRKRINQSIADSALQIALDNNAERRVKGRISAFTSLPDWRERRRHVHVIRADIITNLDQYIEKFIAKVTQNGITVHLAKNAEEAVNLVLEISEYSIQNRRVGKEIRKEKGDQSHLSLAPILFAKSKSMISEEIQLNSALETRGHRVVETDLGEFIVQLRGEKPAHIITPAVHLRRHEVGKLFHEKLGIPYTEDIPILTSTARKVLRDVFLTADVGISGVNFGVVETGSLCIVTNEGNGRMVTTVPPLHIALMGMERLVPTLDDLALMLSMLARSATGQKLSVYTQLINAPRGPLEIDGAQERHLIILDNGRSRIQKSPLKEALYCIRCGACLNACPVFRELGGHAYIGMDGSIAPYPGPIGSVVSPGLIGLEQFGHLAQASSLCGACNDACPIDIDLPKLLTRVRAGKSKEDNTKVGVGLSSISKIGLRLYGLIGSSSKLFSIAQSMAGVGAIMISPFSEWIRFPAFTGWGFSKDFPRPKISRFRSKFQQINTATLPKGRANKISEIVPPNDDNKDFINPTVDMVGRFVRELETVGVNAYRLTSREISNKIINLLKEHEMKTALVWESIPSLDENQLIEAGIKLVRRVEPTIKAGITGAAVAIAETGTLVIPSAKGQFLSASLMPDVHLVVINSSQIVFSLEEALQTEIIRDASSVVLITGPSRTADIEMALTIGVHGPKELIVLIIE